MNLRQIGQFLAVANALNFRKAAELLHMAQPPLSVSIKRLEEELGTPLFIRHRRGLRLSAAGEAILSHARQISFHSDQIRTAAASAANGLGGLLRISFVGSATYTLFPRVLPAFRDRYPQVALELREGTTTQILGQVERGETDLGLIRYPVTEATSANLLPIEYDQLVAALPQGSPLTGSTDLQLRDLAEESFILYSSVSASNLRGQVLSACQTAGFTPRVVQEAVQIQTLLSLVESGIGIALVPSVCQVHGTKGISFRALADASGRLDVAIALATHRETESAAAARFRQLLTGFSEESHRGKPAIRPRTSIAT